MESCPLSHPDDVIHLSELFCLVRSQLEAFVVPQEMCGRRPRQAGGKPMEVGRVGLRCVHCARADLVGGSDGHCGSDSAAGRGAVIFPQSIRLVYQAARNYQRYHFLACPAMPEAIKARYNALKEPGGKRQRSAKTAPQYWEDSCRRLGMIDDSAKGIRLSTGRFLNKGERVPNDACSSSPSGSQLLWNPPLVRTPQEYITPTESIAQRRSFELLERSALEFRQPKLPTSCSDGVNIVPARFDQTALPLSQSHNSVGSKPTLPIANPFAEVNNRTEQDLVPNKAIKRHVLPLKVPSDTVSLDATDERARGVAATLSDEIILDRLLLAQSTVQAVSEICEFSTPHDSKRKNDITTKTQQSQESEMRYLGAELYELFSGRSPNGLNSGIDDSEPDNPHEDDGQRHLKRGKRREAKRYIPLSDLGLPAPLCNIVSSLLDYSSGSPCAIYNSIEEVDQDLRALASKPGSLLFHTATGDIDIFQNDLYGRSSEVSLLEKTYERVINAGTIGANMVLVSGHSGSGKSALVDHVSSRFVLRGACFASGKFDAMQQLQPLSAIIAALDDYCGLLVQDSGRQGRVREAIYAAIGNDVMVLANLVPNLQEIVGVVEQSPVHVSGREALQRLMFQIRMLFRATCSHEHPVVFVLDDLQWADEISLKLMQELVTDSEVRGLLFIGCFRTNEVGASHPLTTCVESIRRCCSINIVHIYVDNLDEENINTLLSDKLHLVPRVTRPLAQVVLSKTGGNALFAVQFITSLCDKGLLHFSLSSKQFEWDIGRVRSVEIADGVVCLMTAKLLKLAPPVQSALSVAAGFGAQCNELVLQILDRAQDSVMSVAAALDIAVAEGLMSKTGSLYEFSHDQIQCPCYLLVPKPECVHFHLKIGRSLHRWSSSEEMQLFLFVVLDQLHRGSDLITEQREKLELARLSLKAGETASEMSAFLPAAAYFNAGIRLLDQADWDNNRDLCFNLYNHCSETECILGDFDQLKGHVDEMLSRASTLQEKLRPYLTLVQALGSQGLARDAINTALPVISQLGEPFPFIVTEDMIKSEVASTQNLLRTKSEEELGNLAEMKDYEKQQAMKYFHLLILYVFSEKREYYPIIVCRMVRISLEHGVCRESAFGFASFGMILSGLLGDAYGGFRLGKVGINLISRFQAQEYLAKVFVSVHGFISPWIEPIQSTLPCLREAIDVGRSCGDTEYSCIASHVHDGSALCSGKALVPLVEEMRTHEKEMLEHNQRFTYNLQQIILQATLNLIGPCHEPTKLIGEETNEDNSDATKSEIGRTYSKHVLRYFYQMWLEYLFGQYEKAWQTSDMGAGMKKHSVARFPYVCNHTFYKGLTALVLARKEGKNKYDNCIESSIGQMKVWTSSAPWNCEHKLELMNGEKAFLEGDADGAAKAYAKAVDLAARRSFLHEQALALERTGVFYSERGQHDAATEFFKKAHECYARWGGHAKAAHVQMQYL